MVKTANVPCQLIIDAAKVGDNSRISLLIQEDPTLVNCRDEHYLTPLHEACSYGHIDAVKTLIEHKCAIDATDKRGATPLHFASTQGMAQITELLLAKGADVNAQDEWGRTPLHLCVYEEPLSLNRIEVARILILNGANVNQKDNNGNTPLDEALEAEEHKISELLIQHGAG